MKKTKRKTYNIFQNCAFMIRRAWRDCKSVLVVALGIILCGVAANLLELFVVPAILEAVERGVSPGALAGMILWFTVGMALVRALRGYLDTNAMFDRIQVRSTLCLDLHMTFCRASFPHIEDPDYLKRTEEAEKCVTDNNGGGEYIWTTLTELLTNVICFIVYLLLLAQVGPWVAALCIALSAAGYFAGEHIRAWRYRHREEEAALMHKADYVVYRSRDMKLAKDIRIFGIGPWLTELYEKYSRLMQDFYVKAYRQDMWADLLDVVLALLRNGAAYGLLIAMALEGKLTAAAFVLYFTAVSGFTQWVTGIFSGLGELHQQSLDLSAMREFLEEPELFRFEDGKPLPVKEERLYTLELRDVSFRYPGADHDTLSHVNLTIHPGEKLALVGKNGAGKTTLIKLLCGLLQPTTGWLTVDGSAIGPYTKSVVSYLPDRMYFADWMKASDLFDLFRDFYSDFQYEKAIDMCRSLGVDPGDRLKSMSKGTKEKVQLVLVMARNARLYLLDEPIAGVDPAARDFILRTILTNYNEEGTVLISTHLISDVEKVLDEAIFLKEGKIMLHATVDDIREREGKSVDALFREIFRAMPMEGGGF